MARVRQTPLPDDAFVHLTRLQAAYEELAARENAASQKEMGANICHRLVGINPPMRHVGWTVAIEFGLQGDTQLKWAQIGLRGDSHTYQLAWWE